MPSNAPGSHLRMKLKAIVCRVTRRHRFQWSQRTFKGTVRRGCGCCGLIGPWV